MNKSKKDNEEEVYLRDEKFIKPGKIKKMIKSMDEFQGARFSSSGLELMSDIVTEFIEIIALCALDNSKRPKQFVDSTGIKIALREFGFEDIADKLPDLSQFTEDMRQKYE